MDTENERLGKEFKKANKALLTLKEARDDMQTVPYVAQYAQQDPEKIYRIYRDSLMVRFRYTFDATWKYLRDYLQALGIVIAVPSPKTTFRESLKARILSADEVRLALEMVDDRNLTTHGYDQALIEEISKKIPAYTQVLETVLQKTKT